MGRLPRRSMRGSDRVNKTPGCCSTPAPASFPSPYSNNDCIIPSPDLTALLLQQWKTLTLSLPPLATRSCRDAGKKSLRPGPPSPSWWCFWRGSWVRGIKRYVETRQGGKQILIRTLCAQLGVMCRCLGRNALRTLWASVPLLVPERVVPEL